MHLSYRPNNTIVFLHVFLILKIFVVGTLDLNFLIVQREQEYNLYQKLFVLVSSMIWAVVAMLMFV